MFKHWISSEELDEELILKGFFFFRENLTGEILKEVSHKIQYNIYVEYVMNLESQECAHLKISVCLISIVPPTNKNTALPVNSIYSFLLLYYLK